MAFRERELAEPPMPPSAWDREGGGEPDARRDEDILRNRHAGIIEVPSGTGSPSRGPLSGHVGVGRPGGQLKVESRTSPDKPRYGRVETTMNLFRAMDEEEGAAGV